METIGRVISYSQGNLILRATMVVLITLLIIELKLNSS